MELQPSPVVVRLFEVLNISLALKFLFHIRVSCLHCFPRVIAPRLASIFNTTEDASMVTLPLDAFARMSLNKLI